MKTLLVTGGAGFIGGNFVLHLLARGDVRVVNLDALTYAGNPETLADVRAHPAHVFVHGDIGDHVLVGDLLTRYRPAAVVNFAAESHVDRSIDGPAAFVQTNVVGTLSLLEAVREYWRGLGDVQRAGFRFVHISTDEVYGSLGASGRFTEDFPYAPNSPYAASKAASDHLVRAFHRTYGLPTLTTNCSNNYGPYQFPEKLIPLLMLNARRGRELPVYGDGGNIRDWLFVLDHCRALIRVLEAGVVGETYNIGGDCERTNLEVVHAVCALMDEQFPDSPHRPHEGLVRLVADRPGHDRRYAIDASKIRRELGWVPEESFESGLRKTVRWYAEHAEWCERVLDGRYRGERLGLGADGEAAASARANGD